MFFWCGTVLQDSSLIHFMTYFFPFSAMVWLSSMRQSVAGMLWQPGGTFQPNLLRWNIIRNELKQFVKNSGSKILHLMNMACFFRNISWLRNFSRNWIKTEFSGNPTETLRWESWLLLKRLSWLCWTRQGQTRVIPPSELGTCINCCHNLTLF